MKNTSLFFTFLVAGTIAAASSLFASLLFFNSNANGTSPGVLLLLVIIEELIKFALLYFAIGISKTDQITNRLFLAAIFGFGFALFETVLILLSGKEIGPALIFPFLVHMATSILLSLGIPFHKEEYRLWRTFIFILLAIIVHLCYNLAIANLI